MISDQPPPETCGQPPDPGEPLPPGQEVITVAGPWTVLSCVTAACTGCGAVPLDEDTGMTPRPPSAHAPATACASTCSSPWPEPRRADERRAENAMSDPARTEQAEDGQPAGGRPCRLTEKRRNSPR
jgi:hypothetical protein